MRFLLNPNEGRAQQLYRAMKRRIRFWRKHGWCYGIFTCLKHGPPGFFTGSLWCDVMVQKLTCTCSSCLLVQVICENDSQTHTSRHSGARLSTNAPIPSCLSCSAKHPQNKRFSYATPCGKGTSMAMLTQSLTLVKAGMLHPAICLASAIASVMRVSCGTTRLTRPMRSASVADILLGRWTG